MRAWCRLQPNPLFIIVVAVLGSDFLLPSSAFAGSDGNFPFLCMEYLPRLGLLDRN